MNNPQAFLSRSLFNMKIQTRSVTDFLNAPDAGVFGALVYGPDSGQALAHSRTIIQKILGSNYEPTSIIEMDDASLKSDPAKLADECGAMNLLGGRRIVWLRNISDKHVSLIESCISLLVKDCYLLVTAGDLASRDKLRGLFEQRKDLAAVACYRLEGNQLAMHIRGILEAEQFRVDRNVVDTLVRELGNDLMITKNELEKLCLYAHGKSQITLEDVEATLLHNDQHEIDALCQHYCDANAAGFDSLWQHLVRDGEQPIVLIRSISRYVGRLLEMKLSMQQQEMSAEQVVESAKPKIFWKQAPIMTRQLKRLRSGDLLLMLHQCNQAEASFKSTSLPPELIVSHVLEMRFRANI